MTYWAACYTDVGAECKARDGIEVLDRGTFLPTFARVYYSGGRRKAFERPILNRYILVALRDRQDEAWSSINHVEGVHKVLCNDGFPCRVADRDVVSLMMAHVSGACNSVQHRDAQGRFSRRQRNPSRRRRPRKGKKYMGNVTHINGNAGNATKQAS